jgi:tetratricopeptide (TPR) repeat protein
MAEKNHCTRTRVYAVREKARRSLGDWAGADRDLKKFLKARPSDPKSWCARGERKLALDPRDPGGALADFDEALHLDAYNLDAFRDKASVLAEDPHRQVEAVLVLDQVMKQVPNSVNDRAGRAVLLARVGRSPDALREVEAIAKLGDDALFHYQLASAAIIAGDKSLGLNHLRSALRKDPSFATQMPVDPDLRSIWKEADFLNLIAAANTLRIK